MIRPVSRARAARQRAATPTHRNASSSMASNFMRRIPSSRDIGGGGGRESSYSSIRATPVYETMPHMPSNESAGSENFRHHCHFRAPFFLRRKSRISASIGFSISPSACASAKIAGADAPSDRVPRHPALYGYRTGGDALDISFSVSNSTPPSFSIMSLIFTVGGAEANMVRSFFGISQRSVSFTVRYPVFLMNGAMAFSP